MNWKIISLIIISFLTIPVLSQNIIQKDIIQLRSGFNSDLEEKEDNYPIDFRNEVSLIFSASYHFYKSFISSQDANNCSFYPSCSTYAIETIKTNGLMGIFDAFDRLSRCNGFSSDKYHKHTDSHHLHDPVKKIR